MIEYAGKLNYETWKIVYGPSKPGWRLAEEAVLCLAQGDVLSCFTKSKASIVHNVANGRCPSKVSS